MVRCPRPLLDPPLSIELLTLDAQLDVVDRESSGEGGGGG